VGGGGCIGIGIGTRGRGRGCRARRRIHLVLVLAVVVAPQTRPTGDGRQKAEALRVSVSRAARPWACVRLWVWTGGTGVCYNVVSVCSLVSYTRSHIRSHVKQASKGKGLTRLVSVLHLHPSFLLSNILPFFKQYTEVPGESRIDITDVSFSLADRMCYVGEASGAWCAAHEAPLLLCFIRRCGVRPTGNPSLVLVLVSRVRGAVRVASQCRGVRQFFSGLGCP
jgi:hypothetical protein